MDTMYLLLDTHSSDENWNGECDVAYVPVSEEYAKQLLLRMDRAKAMKEEDRDLTQVCFGAPGLQYFERCDEIEGVEDDLANDVPVVMNELPPIPEDALRRTDCDEVVVSVERDEVYFRAYPRDSDVLVSTSTVPRGVLEGLFRK